MYCGDYVGGQPLPGDIYFRDGAFQRFDLDGWHLLDTFRGAYSAQAAYAPGDVVVRAGALWIFTPEVGPGTWTCIAGTSSKDADR